MTHGSGGRAMAQLIEELFLAAFDNDWLRAANDNACFAVQSGRMVMATDSHVVSPLFFPGGDIGCLSVHGTINDVAMSGAKPLYLSASFILEEGFPLADLKRIVDSMAQAAREAGVPIVTGDTKVVEQGKGDGVFITTTGVGVVPEGVNISGDRARPGDAILVSGTLGDHGVAIMAQRESLGFETRSAPTRRRCTSWSRAWSKRCRTSMPCATRRAAASPPRSTRSPASPASA
jgi:hydrogenase expression/formation protein HypE